jgi:hypothetical protein
VVSVTERKEQDLTKRFDDTSIDWAVIESQLVAWGKFYHAGKKLRLNLSFNYVDTTNTLLRRGDKRGSSSTTRQMLAVTDLAQPLVPTPSGARDYLYINSLSAHYSLLLLFLL